jgi:biopolymer transport protein ExbD
MNPTRLVLLLLTIGIVFSIPCFGQQTPPVVTQPTETTRTIKDRDSSWLSITVLKYKYKLRLLNKTNVLTTGIEIDKFLVAKKAMIDPNKISINADRTIEVRRVAGIIDILKKHGYLHFSLWAE